MKKIIPIIIILMVAIALMAACAASAPEADTTRPHVSVSFDYSEGLSYAPSYAVWIEDEDGNTATLFATAKAAADNWGGQQRPSVLPIWKGIRQADVISGATPKGKAELTLNIPETFMDKKLTLFIEANASFDYNDYYAEDLSEGDEGYNDVNGQPSALWSVDIDTSAESGSLSPDLAGTGEVLGADHELHSAEHLTTAASLLSNIEATWQMGE